MTRDLIHTDLALGAWQATTDAAPLRDRATGLATVRIPIVFRGSRAQAVQTFRHGAQNCPHGGSGMFCAGPADIQLIPNTGTDPHWDMNVEWIGLHSQFLADGGTSAGLAYDVHIDWSHREKNYPEEIPVEGGSPVVFTPEYPFAPSGTSTGGNKRKAKHYDHLPTATITVVMVHAQPPSPSHPLIKLILSKLPKNWPGIIQDYTGLTEPVWVTWASRPSPKTVSGKVNNSNDWFIRNIQNTDRVSATAYPGANAVHVCTVTATLEPLLQPS